MHPPTDDRHVETPDLQAQLERHADAIARDARRFDEIDQPMWDALAAEARASEGRLPRPPTLATPAGRWFLRQRPAPSDPCCRPCETPGRDEDGAGSQVCHDLPLIKHLNPSPIGTGGYDEFAGLTPTTRPSGFGFFNALYEHEPGDGPLHGGSLRFGWSRPMAQLDGPRAIMLAPMPQTRALLQAAIELDCGAAGTAMLNLSWRLEARIVSQQSGVHAHLMALGPMRAAHAGANQRVVDFVPNGPLNLAPGGNVFLVRPTDVIMVVLTVKIFSLAVGATARCFFEQLALEGDPDRFWRLCEV